MLCNLEVFGHRIKRRIDVMEYWYNDIVERWKAISRLVEKYGTHEEECAWKLCKEDFTKLKIDIEKFIKR
jgi:hypothetical protein